MYRRDALSALDTSEDDLEDLVTLLERDDNERRNDLEDQRIDPENTDFDPDCK